LQLVEDPPDQFHGSYCQVLPHLLLLLLLRQAFKAQMGDKAAGVNDDLLKMLSGTQMVRAMRQHKQQHSILV
jgi:hypothetical protein